MNFLEVAICGTESVIQPVWSIVNLIINLIMIGIPILLIVFGMYDLGKAVIASKEDEVKKATKALGRRFLYAVGVFLVVWVVTFIFSNLANLVGNEENLSEKDTNAWHVCSKCNIRGRGKENCN